MIKPFMAAVGLVIASLIASFVAVDIATSRDMRDTVVKVDENCSGVFVSRNIVATAGHCTSLNAAHTITLRDGRSFKGMTILDDDSQDVALIFVDTKDKIEYAPLYCDYSAQIGDRVTIIGHPAMVFQWFVSHGYVGGFGKTSDGVIEYIWTTAPIAPGNSGGPVFYNGSVIGLVSIGITKNFSINGIAHIKHLCKVING